MLSMKETIFDILSNDERIIVLSDKQTNQLVTWNQSLTLQVFSLKDSAWEETAILTLAKQPASFKEARKKASEWLHE
jgi:hypothetical protein